MKIGGLQRVSLIDYPGKISAIVFTQGCNFRCSYCHNPELVDSKQFQSCLPEKDILEYLNKRQGKLDAVTLTGGEPSCQADLISFIQQIRKLGFAIKVDTNGTRPDVIRSLIQEKLIDYIAMDVKAPPEQYALIVNAPVDTDSIFESVRIILASKIAHEFRTTVVQSQLTETDLLAIALEIQGAQRYILQKYRPTKPLDRKFLEETTWPDEVLLKIKKTLEKNIEQVIIR